MNVIDTETGLWYRASGYDDRVELEPQEKPTVDGWQQLFESDRWQIVEPDKIE